MLSVFTPSHDPKWLDDCFKSLQDQTYSDWEWVVVMNGGATWIPPMVDKRVTVLTLNDVSGVGALKAYAVNLCRGDIFVELDHDDVLAPEALDWVAYTFGQNPDAGMVYSQFSQIDAAGNHMFAPFGPGYGWRYKRHGDMTYPITMSPTPHNVSHIWWAPNHLRAFSRQMYEAAGGYDPTLEVLDDQDLMSRLYQQGEFVLIDRPLYFQRAHGENTQLERNAFIQTETLNLYEKYIQANSLAWAKREGLYALDLGGAHNKPEGYLGVDQHPGADFQHTFPNPMDLPDSSVGVIRAVDFLEHVVDRVAMMNEIHRLLAPGGMLLSMTPSCEGWGADQDPTHVARWNPNSFWYYTDKNYAKFVPEITARFQVSRITHGFPSPWHEQNRIPYVTANLIAVKDGMSRCGGVLHWD